MRNRILIAPLTGTSGIPSISIGCPHFCVAAIVAVLISWFLASPASAQGSSSGFNPDAELARLRSTRANLERVQRMFYLGELTANSGREDVARNAYGDVLSTFERLSGNARSLALPYAAQSALSLAAMTHVAYRDSPLRLERYAADSAQRAALLVRTREAYNRALEFRYARATFEALFFRAYALQEWNTGGLDYAAERQPGTELLEQTIRDLNLSRQLLDQAIREHQQILHLADSLGFSGGSGDRDVSEWVSLAREQLAAIPQQRDSLVAREEALQTIYIERRASRWLARAEPLLWEKVTDLARRDARIADPFFDFVLQSRMVNDVFRPYIFGPSGFLQAHDQAREGAQTVRSEEWMAERFAWRRRQEWRDGEIAMRLSREGLRHLLRSPEMVDSVVVMLRTAADSLPGEARIALSRAAPQPPQIRMPDLPDLGGVDPRLLSGEEHAAKLDEYQRYVTRMDSVSRQIEAYRAAVRSFSETVAAYVGQPLPSAADRYLRVRRALRATETLLLDTLSALVLEQTRSALERSRLAAGWAPPGEVSASMQQTIADHAQTTSQNLRLAAAISREQAARYRVEVSRLRQTPLRDDLAETAATLEHFAGTLEQQAALFAMGTG